MKMREIFLNFFLNRENQFGTLFYYTIILLLASGAVIFAVTSWLVSPIKKLSKATKGVADGHLIVPVVVSSEDEIGQLTKDFNTMTERLSTTMKELHEAVERQEVFVGNFAHELKTPLAVVSSQVEMLEIAGDKIDRSYYYSSIHEELDKMSRMVGELLDFSMLDNQMSSMEIAV